MLKECDADRALAEMVRVTKPDGRVGVIVRSLDLNTLRTGSGERTPWSRSPSAEDEGSTIQDIRGHRMSTPAGNQPSYDGLIEIALRGVEELQDPKKRKHWLANYPLSISRIGPVLITPDGYQPHRRSSRSESTSELLAWS